MCELEEPIPHLRKEAAMTRATKSKKVESTKVTPARTADAAVPETVASDDHNWMLDLFDWPFFGRDWHVTTRLFDTERFFTDRDEDRFPMRVEQLRDGDDLIIRAEIPGIDPDADVEIGIEGRRLTIDATREDRTESSEDGYRSEFRYGHFHRMMTLPEGADTDAVAATYTDGILEVRVPVHPDVEKTTKVPVSRS
jgi:HSP20 family protein